MRMRFTVFGLLGLFLAICDNAPAQKVPSTPQAPLELRISGPGILHTGQTLFFKVTLINRSSAPIAISTREPGTTLPTFSWRIRNLSGERNPTREPHVIVCPLSGVPLKDSDIIVLRPGEHFDVQKPGDPSETFIFPGKGLYFATYAYSFSAWVLDRKNEKTITESAALSPKYIELLKNTPALSVVSNAWPMRYE